MPPLDDCLGHQADEGCEAPPVLEAGSIADGGNERARRKRPDAGDRGETLARLVRLVPSHHLPVEIEDLVLQQAILIDQAHHRAACDYP